MNQKLNWSSVGIFVAVIGTGMLNPASVFAIEDDPCVPLLHGAPDLSSKETQWVKKFILSQFRTPSKTELEAAGIKGFDSSFLFGGELLEHYSNSIVFSSDEQAVFRKALYEKMIQWVKINKVFPPNMDEFQQFLGISADKKKYFVRLFNRKYGLFRGYEEAFIGRARSLSELAPTLAKYQDLRQFNPDVQANVIAALKDSDQFISTGFVNGQPTADGIYASSRLLQNHLNPKQTTPYLVFPAYGMSSGLPERFFDPENQMYVIPKTLVLHDQYGNAFSINEVPVGPRALKSETGMIRVMSPSKKLVIVHPQAYYLPVATDGKIPGAIIGTGTITAAGFNISSTAIGARISSIQNEMHSTSVTVFEKIAGSRYNLNYGLEASFRARNIPYNEKPMTFQVGNRTVVVPRGFSDLHLHYGEDGVIRDLPLAITLGDTHSPVFDPSFLEAIDRDFIDPKTCLKKTDGSPVDVFLITTNDSFNFDYPSRHTSEDLVAKQSLVHDKLEYHVPLHMKRGMELKKDLLRRFTETRGYTPHLASNYSNHDYDRIKRVLSTGEYLNDPANQLYYEEMNRYRAQGKNFLREFILNHIGMGYPGHIHILGPGDKFAFGSAQNSHGHTGGGRGSRVAPDVRRAAQGASVTADSHIGMFVKNFFDAGHAMLPASYAKTYLNRVNEAVVIQSPVHTQLLFFMGDSFYGAQTHGNPALEFRKDPYFKDLPLDLQTVPDNVNGMDQYNQLFAPK